MGQKKFYKITAFQLPHLLSIMAPTEPPQLPGKCPESKGTNLGYLSIVTDTTLRPPGK